MAAGKSRAILTALCLQCWVVVIGSDEWRVRIQTQSQKLSRPAGANVTLHCDVINLDSSVVTWSKDGQVVSADSFKVIQDDRIDVFHKPGQGVTLNIALLRVTDSGLYKCTVNRNREVLTLQHQLIVEVPPYIESLHPLNGSITVHSGSRLRLECRAGGQPPPTVYWKRLHNQPMEWLVGGPTSVAGETLELKNASREMGGEYVCSADNGIGLGPVTRTININILYPPDVSAERDWVHAGEGEEVMLVCKVYANPTPRIHWYKNTMKLIEGERTHIQNIGNSYRLVLSSVIEQDYGEYSCRASNPLEEEVTQKIILTGKPSQPLIVGDREGRDRYSYDLEWEVRSAYPIAAHEVAYWESDKVDADAALPPRHAHVRRVPGAGQSTLTFTYSMKGLRNNTFYDVTVRTQNKYGWSPFSLPFTFHTVDKDNISLEVRVPAETARPLYYGDAPLKSEPVTSSSVVWWPITELLLLLLLTFSCQSV